MPAQELVNPNLHVVLVHFPIALLLTGTLIEVFSFLGWRTSGFRIAGRWMILLGALLAIPTALSGLYALSDVAGMGNHAPIGSTWKATLAASPVARDEHAWGMLERHAYLNGGAVALFAVIVVVWLSGSDEWRRKVHLPLTVLLVLGVGAMVASAWYGGEVVYRHGVAVREGQAMPGAGPVAAGESGSELERPSTVPAAAAAAPSTSPSSPAHEAADYARKVERAVPPLQIHIILAGFAVSFALAALGLSLRAANTARAAVLVEPADELSDLAAAYGARPVRPQVPVEPAFDEVGAARVELIDRSRVPSARFWLLAALLALCTAGFGWWVLVRSESVQNMWDFAGLWNQHIKLSDRRMVHAIAGGSIVLLPLLLSLFARFAPRRRGLIFGLGLLLIVAVAVQVWLGVLLMWDTPDGKLTGFNS